MMLAQTGPRWYDLIKKNFVTKPNRLKFTLPRTTTLGEQITHWEIEFEFEDGQNLIWRICEEPVGGRRMKDLVIDNEIVPTRYKSLMSPNLKSFFQNSTVLQAQPSDPLFRHRIWRENIM